MQERWRLHPPVHWLAAAYLKYKPPKAVANDTGAGPDPGPSIDELKAQFPGGMIR